MFSPLGCLGRGLNWGKLRRACLSTWPPGRIFRADRASLRAAQFKPPTEIYPEGAAQRGRLSLVTFFGGAKKVTCRRATPGHRPVNPNSLRASDETNSRQKPNRQPCKNINHKAPERFDSQMVMLGRKQLLVEKPPRLDKYSRLLRPFFNANDSMVGGHPKEQMTHHCCKRNQKQAQFGQYQGVFRIQGLCPTDSQPLPRRQHRIRIQRQRID